jgi:thiol-disulfide isomerase/thioredoxin
MKLRLNFPIFDTLKQHFPLFNKTSPNMKIVPFFLLLLLPFISKAQGMNFDHSDIKEAIKIAKKQGQLVFVDFTADWCKPCKAMDAEVFQDPSVAEKMNAFFVCVRLDYNDAAVRSIVSQYGYNGIPLTLCLDTLGNVLSNTFGYGIKTNAVVQLDYMISFHPKGKKYLQIEKAFKQIATPSSTVFASYLGARRTYGLRNTTVLNDYWKKLSPQEVEIDSTQLVFLADYNTDLKGDIFEYLLKNKSNILIKNRLAALVMFNLQLAIKNEDKSLLKEIQKANIRIWEDPSVSEVENEQLNLDYFLKTQNEKQFHKTALSFLKKYKNQTGEHIDAKIQRIKNLYATGVVKNQKYATEFEAALKEK